MKKNIYLLFIATIIFSGCENQNQSDFQEYSKYDSNVRLDLKMINYLEMRDLPALQKVDLWNNTYGLGIKIVTAHYEVYTTLLEPLVLSKIPGFVESCYRGYNDQIFSPVETSNRLRVFLFADRQQWEEYTKDFTGDQAQLYLQIKEGAYYLKGDCITYNIGADDIFSVLGHECWHQFNKRFFQFRLPSWLDEGIATHFEISKYNEGLFTFQPSDNFNRLAGLKLILQKNRMIPLKDLLKLNPGEIVGSARNGSDNMIAFYSQVYALVRFLREDDYGKRLPQYHKMLMDGINGNWPLDDISKRFAYDRNIQLTAAWNHRIGPTLFEYYIGGNIEDIELEYLRFCRKIVYHVKF